MLIWHHLTQGDALSRLVVVVLLAMSVGTWVVILWKWWLLRRVGSGVPLSVAMFCQSVNLKDATDKLSVTDADGLVRELIRAVDVAVHGDLESGQTATLGRQAQAAARATRLLREALVMAQQRLQYGQVLLATVGATAPFVGLLGTVWGIYHALQAMATEGQVTLAQVSGPVGEALVMTAAGLAVAIPAVLAYNVLGRCAARIEAVLEAFAHDLRELVLTESAASPVHWV